MWVTLVGDGTGKCLVAPTEELLAQWSCLVGAQGPKGRTRPGRHISIQQIDANLQPPLGRCINRMSKTTNDTCNCSRNQVDWTRALRISQSVFRHRSWRECSSVRTSRGDVWASAAWGGWCRSFGFFVLLIVWSTLGSGQDYSSRFVPGLCPTIAQFPDWVGTLLHVLVGSLRTCWIPLHWVNATFIFMCSNSFIMTF